jgi:hypothetical protein
MKCGRCGETFLKREQADHKCPVTDEQRDALAMRVNAAFDSIAGASYYGFSFREVLVEDPKALDAAEALVAALRKAHVMGVDPPLRPKIDFVNNRGE